MQNGRGGHKENSGPGGKGREQKMKRWKESTLVGDSSPLGKVVEAAFVSPLSPQVIFFLVKKEKKIFLR